jgi:hypothetical protein
MANDAAERRDFATAQRCMGAAQRIAAQRDSAHEAAVNELVAAQIAGRAGSGGAARQHAETALAAFQRMSMHWHEAKAQKLLSQG